MFDFIPGFDSTKFRPQDGTHLEGCGLLRDEQSGLLHNLIKVDKLFTIPQYDARLRRRDAHARPNARAALPALSCRFHSLTASLWTTPLPSLAEKYPELRALPRLHPCILESKADGSHKNTIRMKAADVHTWARHRCTRAHAHPHTQSPSGLSLTHSPTLSPRARGSVELLEPLLGDAAATNKAWQSWKAHVAYFNLMMGQSFTRADVERLDVLIDRHQALFDKVPNYHRVPKHHFAKHVPRDILRCGYAPAPPTVSLSGDARDARG